MPTTNKPNMDELSKALEDARRAYEEGLKAIRAEETRKAAAEMRGAWATVAHAYGPVETAVEAGDVQAVAEAFATFSRSVSGFAMLIKPFTRRAPRANGGGNGAPRTSNLRDAIEAIMREHPDTEYTGASMQKAGGFASSGAVAEAFKKMAELGVAVQTSERPRKYRLA